MAQTKKVTSPDGRIQMEINCGEKLEYSVTHDGLQMFSNSPLGFELKDEKAMGAGMQLLNNPTVESKSEAWQPVVRNKHKQVCLTWNEKTFPLTRRK